MLPKARTNLHFFSVRDEIWRPLPSVWLLRAHRGREAGLWPRFVVLWKLIYTCKNLHIHLHRHHFVLISPHQMATRPTSVPVPMRTSTSSPVLWNCTWETSPFPSLRSNCTLNSSKLRVRASLSVLFHAITALILTAGVTQGFQMPIPDWRPSTSFCSSCPPPTTRPCVTWWLTWRGQQNTLE